MFESMLVRLLNLMFAEMNFSCNVIYIWTQYSNSNLNSNLMLYLNSKRFNNFPRK
jgi:hypothetical protein